MGYKSELQFVENLLRNHRLKIRYITADTTVAGSAPELGLHEILNYSYDESAAFDALKNNCKPNTIYQIEDLFFCNYFLFRLPEKKDTFAFIGPYILTPVLKQDVEKIANKYNVAPGHRLQLEQFYQDLTLVADENMLITLLYTLGEYLWGNADNFSFQREFPLSAAVPDAILSEPVTPIPDIQSPEEALRSMQILEKRYESEQRLIQAVTNGQLHKAELYLANMSTRRLEQRLGNPIRDYKNYAIILNTLLRKAAESATVHPIHIDSISSQYARKIDTLTSESGFNALVKEMVRKYCLLVKNHSLKGYSLLIRKVIARIDFDLTADLSLKTQAQLLNVNPSYLSTLFKKETGTTLTEYVNRKRIEHALLLLNSTDMQIQMIAANCGITDVNYFTKTFKKMVGKTPKEYRDMIAGHV